MKQILTIFKWIGSHVWEFVFTIALLTLLGFVLIPKISTVQKNGSGEVCRAEMHLIADEIEAAFEKDAFDWSSVIDQKRSQKLFDALKEQSESKELKEINTSTYFFDLKKTSLLLMCRAHEENDPIEISMPQKYHTNPENADISSKPMGEITVSGVRTYVKGASLDKENPEKMVFSSTDDLKALFDDILVKIKYLDGETKVLSKDEYTLSTDGFDMSKPGEKTIIVSYKGESSINTDIKGFFSFSVMDASLSPPFKVNFGSDRKYILAAWAWSDYVRDTTDENNQAGASIVYFEGDYLYYPDGFLIDRRSDNSDPTVSARDIDKSDRPAYYIKMDKGNISQTEEVKNPKNGMLWMDENEEIYIWQESASKEANAGWLRVYCEITKVQ